MRLQDYMIEVTRAAAQEAFRYAKAMPADKLDWRPLDSGRSVLDQCREMAMCSTWCEEIVDGKQHDHDEASAAAAQAEMESWATIEACEAESDRRLESLFAVFAAMPDERLAETRWLPYDGGRDFTMQEMMDYPRWNFTYHLGQISYIQTLYGDRDIH